MSSPNSLPTATPYKPPYYLLVHWTAAELALQFAGFCDSLCYVKNAPELVFERLVTGLNNSFYNTAKQERDALRGEKKTLQDTVDQLRLELAELKGKNLAKEELASVVSSELGLITRFSAKDTDYEDPLHKVDQRWCYWMDIAKARGDRWRGAMDDMRGMEERHTELGRQREQWEDRWDQPGPMDTERLSEAEADMIRFFNKRNLTELDKRCWLLDEEKATINQGQVWALRNGQIVTVEWRERDKRGGGTWR